MGVGPRASDCEPSGHLVAGRYRLGRSLGRGGMARVWVAHDLATRTEVALKRLLPQRDRRDDVLRFEREFHTLARLRHPRVVEVHDYGVDDAGPYYTMELLDGADLRDVGRVEARRACALLRDVAHALAFLHTRRLIHRDLAPRNVRCTKNGRAKVLDFGVLATVGVCRDTAGTPPFIAPENARGLPLDHRADLYGLGALAYWMLTGRHAYPARAIDDLEVAWRQRPPAPATLVPQLPRALSDLVMSLLSIEPLARPTSAIEVIDRLTAIGGLEPQEVEDRGRGYLVTTDLVGREAEVEQLGRMLGAARRGKGRAVVIESPSGHGKSRLLREVGLRAQVEGLVVAEADGSAADRGPLGLLRALARSLLEVAPIDAVGGAREHAPVIARVIPDLRRQFPGLVDAPTVRDSAEKRMRLQASLAAWLVEVARRRPLCLLVDDLQRVDEASGAVLAAAALASRQHPLLLAATVRTDERVRARAPVRAIRAAADRIALRGLDEPGVERLLEGLFGEIPHLPRLATALHRAGRGSPMHTMELVHGLVDDGHLRFIDGMWVVRDLKGVRLAEALIPAIERRLATLSPRARRLAEVLAVHGGEMALMRLDQLARSDDTEELSPDTFRALDELVDAEVLTVASDRHRFRHDGLRETILRGIDAADLPELHARVGRARDGPDLHEDDELAVGWHLLRGGDRRRGGELLERAGTRLYLAQSFTEAIAPLEAALEVRALRPGSLQASLRIRHMLLLAGCMSDRAVAIRYIEPVIAGYREHGGVAVAERLGPALGRVGALMIGVTWRMLVWLFSRPSRRGPFPLVALGNFFVAIGFSATVYSVSYDIDRLRRLIDAARPVAVFQKSLNYAVFLLAESLLAFPLGRFGDLRRHARHMVGMITRARASRYTPFSRLDLLTGEAGCRLMLALVRVAEQDPDYAKELDQLRGSELRYFELGTLQARLAFHRSRGEEEQARRILAEVEVLLVQLGSAWQMETWLAAASALAYGMNRDVLGLKRSIEELQELVDQGLGFEGALALTRGEYHRERGELDASLEALERALAIVPAEVNIFHQPALAAMADTLVARGDLVRAIAVARRGYDLASDPDVGQFANRVRTARAWALAEAGLGQHDQAAARLDWEIAAAASRASPGLSGSLHEARAIVARQQGDRTAFEWHRLATERAFAPTRNPALIARAERLLDSRHERSVAPAIDDERSTAVSDLETAAPCTSLLSGCRSAEQRRAVALQVLLAAGDASAGHLLLLGDPELLGGAAIDEDLDEDVLRAMRQAVASNAEADATTMTEDGSRWRIVVLHAHGDDGDLPVGVAALRQSLQRPGRGLVRQLAGELVAYDDVSPEVVVSEPGRRRSGTTVAVTP